MDKQKDQIDQTEKELADMVQNQNEDESEDDSKNKDEESEDEDDDSEEDDESEDDEDDSDEDDSEEDDDDESDDDDDSEDDDEDEDSEDDSDEDSDDDSDEDEDDEDSEDDDEEDDSKKDRSKGRKPKDGDEMIPRWQMKAALRKQKKELTKDIKKLAEKPEGDRSATSDEVKAIAKKYGFKEEEGAKFIEEIAAFTAKKYGITDDFIKGVNEASKVAADVKENAEFEKDYTRNESLIKKLYPKAKSRELSLIKRKVRELAYTKKYEKYALSDIIRLNRKSLLTERKKSVDGSRIRSKGKVKYDLNNPDSIPFEDMSLDDFEKVSNALAKNTSGNRFKSSKKK